MTNTTTPIRGWTDGYVALKHRAEELRGWIELNPGTDDWERWPRTTGADVIAIAAFVDPALRRLPLRFAGHGIRGRWYATMENLELYALPSLGSTYPENREFWTSLAAVIVHLSSVEAPLPAQSLWDSLCEYLGRVAEHRNVGPKGDGPFGHFDKVKTFDDLYIEQFKYLRAQRGEDRMAPEPGVGGAPSPIPRTTNGDVILLADYWSKQLATVKRVSGHEGVAKRWQVAIAELDQLARPADPNALYPKNNSFWRALEKVAIQVAVADEAPSDWDRFVDAVGNSITHLPENIAAGAKAIAGGASQVVGSVAEGAGKIVNQAGRGVLSGVGTPLLIGGGLLAAFLLLRNRDGGSRPASE